MTLYGLCREMGECLPSCGLCEFAAANTNPFKALDLRDLEEADFESELFMLPVVPARDACLHESTHLSAWGPTVCDSCAEVVNKALA